MLITSASRSVNSDFVAEAAFFEGEILQRKEGETGLITVWCDVIVLTFSSGKVSYYAADKGIVIELPTGSLINCHGDQDLFDDLLNHFFS
jgi:hypothetical protein